MNRRVLAGTVVAIVGAALVPVTARQLPGLNAGTVTAKVDGGTFSANVSVATLDEDGTLILTNLGNAVQIQVPKAKPGKFELKVDDNGDPIDTILGLKQRDRYITPVSGWLIIEALSGANASGRFEFTGKDLATEAAVKVTDGRFKVKLIGGR